MMGSLVGAFQSQKRSAISVFSSAEIGSVNANTLVVFFAGLPLSYAANYTVTVGGVAVTISSGALVGSTVRLVLAVPVFSGQAVTVAATAHSNIVEFTAQAVTNTVVDIATSYKWFHLWGKTANGRPAVVGRGATDAVLNEALDTIETDVDFTGDAPAVGDIWLIDSEYMLVTALTGGGSPATVTRGYASSTAATHTASTDIMTGTLVQGDSIARWMEHAGTHYVERTVAASRPTYYTGANGQNSLPAAYHDGVDDYLKASNFGMGDYQTNNDFMFWMVVRVRDWNGYETFASGKQAVEGDPAYAGSFLSDKAVGASTALVCLCVTQDFRISFSSEERVYGGTDWYVESSKTLPSNRRVYPGTCILVRVRAKSGKTYIKLNDTWEVEGNFTSNKGSVTAGDFYTGYNVNATKYLNCDIMEMVFSTTHVDAMTSSDTIAAYLNGLFSIWGSDSTIQTLAPTAVTTATLRAYYDISVDNTLPPQDLSGNGLHMVKDITAGPAGAFAKSTVTSITGTIDSATLNSFTVTDNNLYTMSATKYLSTWFSGPAGPTDLLVTIDGQTRRVTLAHIETATPWQYSITPQWTTIPSAGASYTVAFPATEIWEGNSNNYGGQTAVSALLTGQAYTLIYVGCMGMPLVQLYNPSMFLTTTDGLDYDRYDGVGISQFGVSVASAAAATGSIGYPYSKGYGQYLDEAFTVMRVRIVTIASDGLCSSATYMLDGIKSLHPTLSGPAAITSANRMLKISSYHGSNRYGGTILWRAAYVYTGQMSYAEQLKVSNYLLNVISRDQVIGVATGP